MVLLPAEIAALKGKESLQLGAVCTSLGGSKEASGYPVSDAVVQKPPKPEKVDRKIEALFLHGRQSNDNLLLFQSNAFRSAIGKDVNVTVLEGDMIWKYQEKHDLHDADDMVKTLSKGKPFYTWFDVSSDDPRERPYMWKFFDPKVKISYSQEAAKHVDKLLAKVADGGFDIVMGLFEGNIIIEMAIAKLMKEGKSIPWRMSVLIGPMPVRDEKYLGPLATTKTDHPACMVFGKMDQDYYYCRSYQSGFKPPEEYFSNVTVLEWLGGHMIPNTPPRSTEIFARILEEMKYYCGQGPKPVDLPLPPRPASWPLLTMHMAPKKLRVLSLCGGHSCEAVNKMQTAQLKSMLGPNAEWTYLAGSKVWEYYDGEPIPSDTEKMIAGKNPLMNWYLDKAQEGPGRLNRDKQFDPSIKVDFFDIPEVLETFEKYLDENGAQTDNAFDVIVAFSQGCIMLHMLIGHLRKRKLQDKTRVENKACSSEEMPWRMSIMVSGMHVRDKAWQHLVETPTKSTHPVIFVNGKADEYFDYARDGFGTSKSQEEYYENPIVLNHDQSHEFPSGPRGTEIYNTVIDQIWHHCGGRPDSAAAAAPSTSGSGGGKFDLKSFLGPPPR
jgi:hypothetical protein